MKILRRLTSVFAVSVMIVSCHNEVESTTTPTTPSTDINEVCISLPADATRTSIAPDGFTTRWNENDEIAVWAKDSDGNFLLQGSSFLLRYFSPEWVTFQLWLRAAMTTTSAIHALNW